MLAAPHLILKLKDKRSERSSTLLLASDYERIGWKETITGLQSKSKLFTYELFCFIFQLSFSETSLRYLTVQNIP